MKTHKNPLRRMLGLILCLSMLVSLALPALGAAPTTETPKTPTAASDFEFNARTGTIKKYTGSDTDIIIPAAIDGITVKALDDIFTYSEVTTVVVPSTVKVLGDYEFEGCYSMTDLYFYGVPSNLSSIAEYSDLGPFTVHCKVKDEEAFMNELDGYVTVEADISDDLADPAYPSHNLKYTDNGDGTHSAVCTDAGCGYTITNEPHKFVGSTCACGATIDNNDPKFFNFEVRKDGAAWLLGYTGPGGDITIPATYTDGDGKTYNVVGIHSKAFCGYNGGGDHEGQTPTEVAETITGITVPASVTTVEDYAFNYVGRYSTGTWKLEKLVFAAENVTFGKAALAANPNLTSVTLPSKQSTLPTSLLAKSTSLTEISLPATVTEVGPTCFQDCTALRKVNFQSAEPPVMATYVNLYNKILYPFAGCKELILSVPAGSLQKYTTTWSAMLTAAKDCAGDITLVGDGNADPEVASIPDFNIYVEGTTAESESPKYIM